MSILGSSTLDACSKIKFNCLIKSKKKKKMEGWEAGK